MSTFFLFLLKNCLDFLSRYLSLVLIFFGFLFAAFLCFSFFFSSFLFFVPFFLLFFFSYVFPLYFFSFFILHSLPCHFYFLSSFFSVMLFYSPIIFHFLLLAFSYFSYFSLVFSYSLPFSMPLPFLFPCVISIGPAIVSNITVTLDSFFTFHTYHLPLFLFFSIHSFFLSIDTFIHLLTCLLDCSFRLALETLPFCTHPVNTEWRLPSYLQLKTKWKHKLFIDIVFIWPYFFPKLLSMFCFDSFFFVFLFVFYVHSKWLASSENTVTIALLSAFSSWRL